MIRRLLTPWRLRYLMNDKERGTCIFCAAPRARDAAAYWVVHRGQHNFVMLNRYPYSSGHLMIAPYAHWESPLQATAAALEELARILPVCLRVLREAYRPDGFNVGMNLGRAAGAGFAEHYHMHVLPRWEGDTNFMLTLAETRLIPEDLATTYERLRPLFERHAAGPTEAPWKSS